MASQSPKRKTGEYVRGSIADARYMAFVPHPLPPEPSIVFDGELIARLERANQALGRFDGITLMLPDPDLFLYQYVRKEAVLSSQIEGTQSSLSDLMLFELDELPGVPIDDVVEVSNYVSALSHGLSRMKGGFPMSLRLIREMHESLLSKGRGSKKDPGHFRRTQNWIGGRSPATATFVPPPPDRLQSCLSDFEKFLHASADEVPALIKAALAHVQFETIHPFLDGNGRVGRLLIALLLVQDGVLREPSLYLSLYFKSNRTQYYKHLNAVREDGDWESWLKFFLAGVEQTSNSAVAAVQRTLRTFEEDRARLSSLGRKAGSARQVLDEFTRRPILGSAQLEKRLDMSRPTIFSQLAALTELRILNEMTGQRRNRLWVYERYYGILGEGAKPL